MKEIVKDICSWSNEVGIYKISLSKELVVLQGEIFELSSALHDYYKSSDKTNLKEEIGDVFISLINCKYIEYGKEDDVINYVSDIKFFKKRTRHFTDIQAKLARIYASISEGYAKNLDVSIAYSQELIIELNIIAEILNLDLIECVRYSLTKNINRKGKVINDVLIWGCKDD